MRKSMQYLVVIVGLLGFGAVGARADEPSEVSYGLPPGGIEVHLPTPPQQQLAGADILVETWNPSQPAARELEALSWVPGAPNPFPPPLAYTTPPMAWSPGAPPTVRVHTWQPGQPSGIVVHGAY